METDYQSLLDRALTEIPKRTGSGERFEIPRPQTNTVGTRTIVQNFLDICQKLSRDPKHVLKFLTKEMATAASIEGQRGIFQGKFSFETIQRLINAYCNRFVICPICGRPDTKIEKRARFQFLVCEACGARSSVLAG